METLVRLRRGRVPRTLTITLETGRDHASVVVAPRVLTAFSRGVRVGLFGEEAKIAPLESLDVQELSDAWIARWELRLPKLLPEAFAPLADMARASIPTARKLEIREHGPESILVVQAFGTEAEATLRELPWALRFVPAARPRLRFSFNMVPSAHTAASVTEALDAWAEVVRLGAFPPRGRPAGLARPLHLAWPRADELVFELDALACSSWAWEALFGALHAADGEGAIASIEIGTPASLFGGLRQQAAR